MTGLPKDSIQTSSLTKQRTDTRFIKSTHRKGEDGGTWSHRLSAIYSPPPSPSPSPACSHHAWLTRGHPRNNHCTQQLNRANIGVNTIHFPKTWEELRRTRTQWTMTPR